MRQRSSSWLPASAEQQLAAGLTGGAPLMLELAPEAMVAGGSASSVAAKLRRYEQTLDEVREVFISKRGGQIPPARSFRLWEIAETSDIAESHKRFLE